jgi:hypothetical protein
MYLKWGTVGEREKGMGRKGGGGGQYTANQGSEWTGIAPRRKEGNTGTGVGISRKRGVIKRIGRAPPISC